MSTITVISKNGAEHTIILDDGDFEQLSKMRWTIGKGYAFRMIAITKWTSVRKELVDYILPPIAGMERDHINGNKLDNRRSNLRYCTHSQNMYNRKTKRGKHNLYIGVRKSTTQGKWIASVAVGRHQKYIGTYSTEVEAAKARDYVASQLHGEFAKLNFGPIITPVEVVGLTK